MNEELKKEAICQLCGEPMPEGEQMFNYHGYSGPCPKPPLVVKKNTNEELKKELWHDEFYHQFGNKGAPAYINPVLLRQVYGFINEIIDRATLAERKRCAEIAREVAKEYGLPKTGEILIKKLYAE